MKVDIVIVNWNSAIQLQNCIRSIRLHHGDHLGKCIVVDNGSNDGSLDFLRTASDVEIIELNKNCGFGKATNRGVSRGTSPLILLLNPDACLLENALPEAVSFLDKDENAKVGIVGIQLLDDAGEVQRTCAKFPTFFSMLAKSLGLTMAIRSLDYHMSTWDHRTTRQVDHVIGAFYLVRRNLFEALEGFDERFFVYLEDLDLSLRARKMGHDTVFLANAQAYHKGGGVSEQVLAHRLFYSLRSRLQYVFKNFGIVSAITIAATTLLVEPILRGVALLLSRRPRELADLARAYIMLWSWVLRSQSLGAC